MMPRSCTQGDSTGPNSRTYADGDNGSAGENSILLFGVRVTQGNSFRKSASMTDLSQYDQPLPQDSNADAGYASDDVVHASGHSRERKRGIPWTEEEHRLFLLGLQQVGKGDWRGISRNFVKTRTPTQVASHAQKYFLRRHNQNRRRRRSSLFDITATDTVTESSTTMEEGRVHTEPSVPPKYPHYSGFGIGSSCFQMMPSLPLTPVGAKLMRSTRILPVAPSSKMAKLRLREKGQVADSLPASKEKSSSVAFEVMSGKPDTNNMISVA